MTTMHLVPLSPAELCILVDALQFRADMSDTVHSPHVSQMEQLTARFTEHLQQGEQHVELLSSQMGGSQ